MINRSYEIKEEASILHFDVEWFTQNEDNSAPERLSIIKSAVAVIARNPITFHEERLSRQHLEHGWKNSFHLYTDLLFEHNAQGCMREFVENKVWGKVRSDPRMTCPSSGKPIIDLGIYNKNRTFRIPGSCKMALPKDPIYDPILPLPSKAFFLETRMADRGESLGAIPRPLFF